MMPILERHPHQSNLKPGTEVSLTVVVTVYKETQAIRESVERVMRNDQQGCIQEFILVASPKSPPETIEICNDLIQKYPLVKLHIQKNAPGVGFAIREGMQLAKGNYIALLSADLETEPEAIDRMVKKIKETGCDQVVGSRWLKGGGFRKYGKIKLVCNWCFQRIFRVLFRTSLTDISYGYKILSKKISDEMNWTAQFHEIYIETNIKPLAAGFKIEEVPTLWVGRDQGESVNSFFKNFIYVKKAFLVLFGIDKARKQKGKSI